MKLELFYYNECGFCAGVLNTIKNLKVEDKVELMNIRENPEFAKRLVIECGNKQVPTLFVDGKPMRESEDIKKFLIQSFM